jgi:hypothetical protein
MAKERSETDDNNDNDDDDPTRAGERVDDRGDPVGGQANDRTQSIPTTTTDLVADTCPIGPRVGGARTASGRVEDARSAG